MAPTTGRSQLTTRPLAPDNCRRQVAHCHGFGGSFTIHGDGPEPPISPVTKMLVFSSDPSRSMTLRQVRMCSPVQACTVLNTLCVYG
ncbi:hypothetical protein FQR65_LT08739 [Abscondita terminalis]|nr:hypothetical protein FQR65_LT08739 [Abscondita terminalis]